MTIPDDSYATFSNYSTNVVQGNPVMSPGAGIDLLMPGVDVISTYMGGGYTDMSGTSMASPHAAGLAALYIAEHGRAGNADGVYAIRQALIDSGIPQDSVNGLEITDPRDGNAERIGWAGAQGPPNNPPVAYDQSVSTNEDTPVAITLMASDVDGDALTYSMGTPSHGTLSGTAPNLTYTPDADYNGSDSFTFTANDGAADSNMATVSITVTAVNDPPVADSQSVTTLEDAAVTITLTASDVDGDALTYSVGTPSHGTLSGIAPDLTYTPDAGYNGSDSFTFTANDGAADSNMATVSITVTQSNPQPSVTVDSITYYTSGGKNKNAHLRIIVSLSDNMDNPVSAGLVRIRLSNSTTGQSWNFQDTTGSDGSVLFRLNNCPSGLYTTTVTEVVADGLAWDGAFPANEFTK
jgi:subtilisin family serine protease